MVNQKVGFFERNDKLKQVFNSKAKEVKKLKSQSCFL